MKAAEEAFEPPLSTLQREGGLYLMEEQWDARRHEVENQEATVAQAGALRVVAHGVGVEMGAEATPVRLHQARPAGEQLRQACRQG